MLWVVELLIHMNIQWNTLNFNLQVIVSTFLTLAAPMIITSIQTAAYDPGLPLGLSNLPTGDKRDTFQILMSIFFPFTILLLRLQYQIVQKKRERILELQNPYLFMEFNRLSSFLQKMDEHKKKMVKIDIAFEIAHQMLINLVLVLFSTSETRYKFISCFHQFVSWIFSTNFSQFEQLKMVFCYHNCSNVLWEKIVLVWGKKLRKKFANSRP